MMKCSAARKTETTLSVLPTLDAVSESVALSCLFHIPAPDCGLHVRSAAWKCYNQVQTRPVDSDRGEAGVFTASIVTTLKDSVNKIILFRSAFSVQDCTNAARLETRQPMWRIAIMDRTWNRAVIMLWEVKDWTRVRGKHRW